MQAGPASIIMRWKGKRENSTNWRSAWINFWSTKKRRNKVNRINPPSTNPLHNILHFEIKPLSLHTFLSMSNILHWTFASSHWCIKQHWKSWWEEKPLENWKDRSKVCSLLMAFCQVILYFRIYERVVLKYKSTTHLTLHLREIAHQLLCQFSRWIRFILGTQASNTVELLNESGMLLKLELFSLKIYHMRL